MQEPPEYAFSTKFSLFEDFDAEFSEMIRRYGTQSSDEPGVLWVEIESIHVTPYDILEIQQRANEWGYSVIETHLGQTTVTLTFGEK